MLGIAAEYLAVGLAAIVHRLVVPILGVLDDEVPGAMGRQGGPKQAAVVDQLALQQIPAIGRGAGIENAAGGEGIGLGGLAQGIDGCLLDVGVLVGEEGAEEEIKIKNGTRGLGLGHLLPASDHYESQEAAKHKDPDARGDKQPDVLQALRVAPHQLHEGVAALIVLLPLAAHEGREARLRLIGGHQGLHRCRLGDEERWQRRRRHRQDKVGRRAGQLIAAAHAISEQYVHSEAATRNTNKKSSDVARGWGMGQHLRCY